MVVRLSQRMASHAIDLSVGANTKAVNYLLNLYLEGNDFGMLNFEIGVGCGWFQV